MKLDVPKNHDILNFPQTMNALNLNMVNAHSEYQVYLSQNGKYLFKTDNEIIYAVDFELDSNPYFTAYWFNLTNPYHVKSPGDNKIAQTVICIISEFFRLNPEVLLYLCSTDSGQQAQRARLFLRWFNGAEQQKQYFMKATDVKGVGSDGQAIKEYIALIVQRSHPQLEEIISRFEEEVKMFNDNK